jgi:hypothetical protein
VKDLEVLLLVEVLTRQRHYDVRVCVEHALFLAEKLESDFEAKGADVELVAPNETTGAESLSKEVMLHELKIALVDGVLCLLDVAVLDEKLVDVCTKHAEWSF